MSQEWEIKASSRVCAGTGQPFQDKQSIYSCLSFGAEGYSRADYSEAAWNNEVKAKAISFWKTVYLAPPPPTAEPLKKETAESMLRVFMAKEDYSRINAIYILAVMLERKRVLVERDVQIRPDGVKVRIYEHKKTNEIFTIPDPNLRLDELDVVQQEVNALLGIGPKSPESTPPAEAAAAPESGEQSAG